MLENRSLSKIKKLADKILDDLYNLEDLTNHDIESVGKCVDIMQELDFDAEFKKHN